MTMMSSVMQVLAMPNRLANDKPKYWHQRRRRGIGGSDSAAVLGESKWRTPYDVWCVKTGRDVGTQTNNAIEAGIAFEQAIREMYSNKTGRTVYDPGFVSHSEYKFIVGDVDGLCEDRVLEIKNCRYEWDTIPTDYWFQVQHYMFLHNKTLADLAVMFSGQDFRIFTIEFDPNIWESIIPIYKNFWACVENNIPPELISLSDVNTEYRQSKDTAVQLSDEVCNSIQRLKDLREKRQAIELEESEIEMQIKLALQDNAIGKDSAGNTLVTWRTSKPRQRFNSEKFMADYPEMYSEYLVNGNTSRPFLIK